MSKINLEDDRWILGYPYHILGQIFLQLCLSSAWVGSDGHRLELRCLLLCVLLASEEALLQLPELLSLLIQASCLLM